MQDSTLYGKKKKKLPQCPNPLFLSWLREWYNEASEKNAKSQFTYKKALNTLMRFPLPLKTGKDCKILENFGDKICKMLDDRLQKHIAEHGTDQSVYDIDEKEKPVKMKNVKQVQKNEKQGEVTQVRRVPAAVHELSDSDSDEHTEPQPPARKRQRSGGGVVREYIPQLRSGPYALLLALYRHMQDPDSVGYLSRNDLIQKAQPLADKSFTLPDPGCRYTAWSSMGTLIKKGYVIKENSPARYSLTDKGCELAHKLEAVEVGSNDDNIPFRINEPGIAPPLPQLAPPSHRLPSMHCSDNEEDLDHGITERINRIDSDLKYWYITADDREVIYKDQAMVTVEEKKATRNTLVTEQQQLLQLFRSCPVCASLSLASVHQVVGTMCKVQQTCSSCNHSRVWDSQPSVGAIPEGNLLMSAAILFSDDLGVGFLVKCNYTAVLRAGVKYKLDMSRPHRDDFCYLYLSNDDALELANPPYSHNSQPDDIAPKPTVAETVNITNPKPKPQKKKPVKSTKTEGLTLLPLVTNKDNLMSKREEDSNHTNDIVIINDESRFTGLLQSRETNVFSDKIILPNAEKVTDVIPFASDDPKTRVPPLNGLNEGSSQESSQCSIKSITDSSQSSACSNQPEPDFILLPGQFDIVLCVDNAEFYGQSKGSSKTLLPDLMKNGIQCDLRKLHVGDLLWIAKERVTPLPGQLQSPKGRELVLNYIIERKRMDDLVSSCIDGRFKEQKFRLKKCGLKHLIYLIEDYGSLQHFSIPEATIRQTITNTQVVDEFRVKRTKDSKETVAFLTVLTRYLQSCFRDKTLYASSIESIKEANIPYSVDDIQQRLPTFEEFNQGSVKTKALTVREMFGKQLIQIYGMSAEKALAVTERYPTPSALFRAYRSCTTEKEKENLLSGIKCGKSNRSLGSAQSKQIYQLYNTSSALK